MNRISRKFGSLPYLLSSGRRLRVYSQCYRDVAAFVRPKPLENHLVVVPIGTGVDLHDKPVLDAHPRHLHQHVRR